MRQLRRPQAGDGRKDRARTETRLRRVQTAAFWLTSGRGMAHPISALRTEDRSAAALTIISPQKRMIPNSSLTLSRTARLMYWSTSWKATAPKSSLPY